MVESSRVGRYPLRSRSSLHSTSSELESGTVGRTPSLKSDTRTRSDKLRVQHRDHNTMKDQYESKNFAKYSPDEKTDRDYAVRSKIASFPSFVHYGEPYTVELHPYQEPSKSSVRFDSKMKVAMKVFMHYLTTAWQLYLLQLDRWPVVTKSVTAAVIGVMADVLAQTITYAQLQPNGTCKGWFDCLDVLSLRNQFIIRLAFSPPQHYWYEFLGHLFRRYEVPEPTKGHENAINLDRKQSIEPPSVTARRQPMWVVVAKMVLDQLTFGPLSNLLYFYAIGFMEGRSLAFIQSRIAQDYFNLMIANYKVWPAIILFNFRYVPPQLQLLFGNIVAIFWNTYVVLTTRM